MRRWPGHIKRIVARFILIIRLIFIRRKITVKFAPKDLKIYTRAATVSVWSRIKWKKTLFPKPKVLIGLSLKCNIKCIFCLAHSPLIAEPQEKLLNTTWQTGRVASGKDMYLPFEKFKKIIDDLCYVDPKAILLSGNGETLMYPFMLEALGYIQSKKTLKNKGVHLSTNGAFLNESLAKTIFMKGLESINISVNAAKPETYAIMHFVSENVFHAVAQNIESLMHTAEGFNSSQRVSISFVLCKKNYKEIVEMVRLADSLKIKRAVFRFMYYCRGKRQQLIDYIFDENDGKELKILIFEALHEANKRKIFTNLNSLSHILNTGSKDHFIPPLEDAYSLQIHADGTVNPYDFPYHMGTIYQRSLIDIWYSPQYIEFRTMVKEKNIKRRYLPNRPFCFRCNNVGEGEICRIIF